MERELNVGGYTIYGYVARCSLAAVVSCPPVFSQVWKESDGIFTGNPTKLSNARLVHHVTPREAAELTYFGNEVRH